MVKSQIDTPEETASQAPDRPAVPALDKRTRRQAK